MKRTSVVAPLLLIGIGGLFLARNMYPELPLLDYLARYWPFLLILWGGLRLIEVLVWAATDKPLPARGAGGGEWILVVLLCIFGGSLHAVRGLSTWWPRNVMVGGLDMFGESFEYPIEGQKQASKNPRVVIESFRGNAKITGADTDTVKVTGHRTIRSLDQGGADAANREALFELAGDANEVIVRNNPEKLSGGNVRVTAEMEITVPRNATIEAHGRYGDFDISDINGNVEITSDNAGVRLQNLGGDARIDLAKSDIIRAIGVKGVLELKGHGEDVDLQNIEGAVTVTGAYSGVIQFRNLSKPLRFNNERTDLSVEKLPGQIRMALGDFKASNLVGPVHLSGRSRDVTMSDFTNEMEVVIADRGDINLHPGILPLSKIDVQTRSGDVTLALPAAAKFDLTATTTHGDVTNDFGAPLHIDNEGRGSTLRGSTGGGPSITIHTERGPITVRRASAEDKSVDKPADSEQMREIKPPASSKPLKKTEQ
jgi:DUF4097 and DUF4098 domain-containing protein YvlB